MMHRLRANLLSWTAGGLPVGKRHTLKKPTSQNNAEFKFKNYHIYISSKS
jgi:hypothetical protein